MPTWRTLVYQTSEGFWRWKIYEDEAAYILRHIQRYDAESQPSVVKTHIRNLRTKLGRLPQGAQPIRTVRGVGYAVWHSEGMGKKRSLDA